MATGPLKNLTATPPPAPTVPANEPEPKRVSIVILSEEKFGEFDWLYESIEDEVGKFTKLKANAGEDLALDTVGNVRECLRSPDILYMDERDLVCFSQTRNKPAFTVAVSVQKTGNTYKASFIVIDNEAAAAMKTLEAQGPKNDILQASWNIIRRTFGNKPHKTEVKPLAEINLSLPPAPPPAGKSTFTQVDAEIETSPSSARPSRRNWKWLSIFGASSIVAVSAATVLGAYAKRLESDSQKTSHRDEAFDKYDRSKNIALSANILYGASALFVGGTIVALFVNTEND